MEASLLVAAFEVPPLKSKRGALNPKGPEMSRPKIKNQPH